MDTARTLTGGSLLQSTFGGTFCAVYHVNVKGLCGGRGVTAASHVYLPVALTNSMVYQATK
jgi:hypothetical protein